MTENRDIRMAALRLHGLHPKDRSWLLGRIDPHQRKVVRGLLKELDDLGLIPAEDISGSLTHYPVGKHELNAEDVSDIQRMDAEVVWKIFSRFPERLKALILYAHRWQWSPMVWARTEVHERSRLLRHMAQIDSVKPTVFVSLIRAFAIELKHTLPYGDSGHSHTRLDA